MISKLLPIGLSLLLLASAVSNAEPLLQICSGPTTKELDASALAALPHLEVKGMSRDKTEKTYSGVELSELLRLIGAPAGDTLRGKEMTKALLVTASDGYQVVYSLAEIDSTFRKDHFVLVDRAEGKELDAFEGPLMIVAPGDLKHARWIRQVKRLALVTVSEAAISPAAVQPEKK